jgi:hypothetical protein
LGHRLTIPIYLKGLANLCCTLRAQDKKLNIEI